MPRFSGLFRHLGGAITRRGILVCPDIELLINFVVDGVEDSELATHARSCENCRTDLWIIRVLTGDGEDNRGFEEEATSSRRQLPSLPASSGERGPSQGASYPPAFRAVSAE